MLFGLQELAQPALTSAGANAKWLSGSAMLQLLLCPVRCVAQKLATCKDDSNLLNLINVRSSSSDRHVSMQEGQKGAFDDGRVVTQKLLREHFKAAVARGTRNWWNPTWGSGVGPRQLRGIRSRQDSKECRC